jgi:hypothetical protein
MLANVLCGPPVVCCSWCGHMWLSAGCEVHSEHRNTSERVIVVSRNILWCTVENRRQGASVHAAYRTGRMSRPANLCYVTLLHCGRMLKSGHILRWYPLYRPYLIFTGIHPVKIISAMSVPLSFELSVVVTRLHTKWLWKWGLVPSRSRHFSFLHSIKVLYGNQPASYPNDNGGLEALHWGSSSWIMMLTVCQHLMPSLREHGDISLLPHILDVMHKHGNSFLF